MNILMLLEIPFPTDIRVQKEADVLKRAGHNVILLCPSRDNEPLLDEFDGIEIYRFNANYPEGFFRKKFSLGYQALTFRNLLWAKAIIRIVKDRKIDVLHVHDLLLVATAVSVKRKTGIPIVVDLHENYPELLRIRFGRNKLNWKDRLLIGADRWIKHERSILKYVDHIIVVVEEAKERIIRFGISSDIISVVSNTEDPKYWKSYKVDNKIIHRHRGNFVISYIGGIGTHRGLDVAVNAMSFIKQKDFNFKLVIVGSGGWYGKELEKIAQKLNISENVDFIPRVPIEKVRSYYESCHIGLVPHNSNPHTEATVPHKLFQYMLFKKPVVVSSCKSLKRIVEDIGAGIVFNTGDPEDLAKKIIFLYNRPELRLRLGEKGYSAVSQGQYNWNFDGKVLLEVYVNLRV
jgi:glycosyltransferase involved in cell wall biosynthesis